MDDKRPPVGSQRLTRILGVVDYADVFGEYSSSPHADPIPMRAEGRAPIAIHDEEERMMSY